MGNPKIVSAVLYQNSIKKNIHIILIAIGMLFSGPLFAKNGSVTYCDSLITAGLRQLDKHNNLKSLELLTEAYQIAEKNHWQDQLFSANINIGSNYLSMFDYGEALKYYFAAYNIAVKERKPNQEVLVLNNIAILYAREKNLDKAYEYFKKAYDVSKKEKDAVKVAMYALNLGLVMNDKGNLDKSQMYLREALANAKSKPDLLLIIKTALAENEMLRKHPEEARQMAAPLLAIILNIKGNETAISLLLIIAKSYLQENNYAQAAQYTQTALKNNANLDTKMTIYDILADIYSQNRQYPEALRCKDSVFAIKEKLNEIKNGRDFENARVKFEIQDYKNQIVLNKATITNDRKLFYYIVLAMAAILLLIFFILRNRAIKHKQKKLIAENTSQMLELELEKKKIDSLLQEQQFREQQTETLLEQERLKNEIEYKNRKLSSKALYMSGKDQLIEEIVGLLEGQPEVAKVPAVRNHIRYLKNTLKTDNEWDTFLTHFEEVNQGFLMRLKTLNPSLTANDIRFICYVYMNLSAKEIATMLNISLDACRKRKERVALKLGLPDSTALYRYLSGI